MITMITKVTSPCGLDFKWGQTPVLEVDGEHLGQTTLICRYLGEKHKLAVEDPWIAIRQQEAVENLHDVSNVASFAYYFRSDSLIKFFFFFFNLLNLSHSHFLFFVCSFLLSLLIYSLVMSLYSQRDRW